LSVGFLRPAECLKPKEQRDANYHQAGHEKYDPHQMDIMRFVVEILLGHQNE